MAEKSMLRRKLSNVPFTRVKIEDALWAPKLRAHKGATLKACLEQCEKTGRISNFTKAAGLMEGQFKGIYFNDSDVYKVLEGVAYSLANNPDPELESYADQIIDKIAAAQQPDGYLDTYYTLEAPDKKWTDMEKHEDYCAGHLIEAAIAYYKATGKGKFLGVACKLADYLDSIFGPGKKHWVVGHQEPELALVKLYYQTGKERYLKLAEWFIEERGHGNGMGEIWNKCDWGPRQCQDDRPVRELTDISGHAVRAMYYYSGIADVAAVTGDTGYMEALERLWESVVLRNMYVTGGIGSSRYNEGFTMDYDLPNDTAYCETCASVGMVYWNHRMNLMTGESRYADVLERSMYNGALAGVSLKGDRFFYVNPLTSDGNHHREEWYDCSCCPTQIARFIPSIGDYVYAASEQDIWVNLYISGNASIPVKSGEVKLRQTTNYPWEGNINITVEDNNAGSFFLNLRFPGWCRSLEVKTNGKIVENPIIEKGYIRLGGEWKKGDSITLGLSMPVERVYSDPRINADTGKVALQRGPIVYCLEEADNRHDFDNISLPVEAKYFTEYIHDLLEGITVISAQCRDNGRKLIAIPYYAWDNRTPGRMTVWINEEKNSKESLYHI